MLENKMPWMSMYAPDGAGGGAGSEGTGDATGAADQSAGGETKDQTMSFDDFLKDPGNQAEFDRRISKALKTHQAKTDKEWAERVEEAKTEAAKLAKMNAEQKAEYERTQRENDLTAREAEVTRRELAATARDTLREKGLPESLSDILVYTDAEACNKSIENVEKAFQTAVDEAVKEKLKGGNPPKAGSSRTDSEESMKQEVKKYMNTF